MAGIQTGDLVLYDFINRNQTLKATGSAPSTVINDLKRINSTTVAACTADNRIFFYTISPSYSLAFALTTTHNGPILTLCPIGGGYLVSGSQDYKAIVWNLATMTALTTFTQHGSYVNDIILLDNGQQVASGSSDNTVILLKNFLKILSLFSFWKVKIWNWVTGGLVLTISTTYRTLCLVQVSGTMIATGSESFNSIQLFNFLTGAAAGVISGLVNYATCIALYSSSIIVVGDQSGYVYLADFARLNLVSNIQPHNMAISSVAVTSASKIISIASGPSTFTKQIAVLPGNVLNVLNSSILQPSNSYASNVLPLSPQPTPTRNL